MMQGPHNLMLQACLCKSDMPKKTQQCIDTLKEIEKEYEACFVKGTAYRNP